MTEVSGRSEKVCALEGCGVRFRPLRANNIYHSALCSRRARDQRSRAPESEERVCALPACGERFRPTRSSEKYHSRACAVKAQNARRAASVRSAAPEQVAREDAIAALEAEGYVVQLPQPPVTPLHEFDVSRVRGDRVKVAIISDTHFGSKYQQPTYLNEFLRYAKRSKVQAVLHCGDVTDGPFKRHRNPHEVFKHSWPAMVDYTVDSLPKLGIPYYFISGNHDDWYMDDGGPDVVAAICAERDDFTYLGVTDAFMRFGKVQVEMFHPNEGVSYALSYKLQKHIEGMSPDEKPHIYLAGNYHKACHLPGYRNVEGFLLPAYQSRTHWMRGKRLASIVGGLILEFGTTPKGLASSMRLEWVLEREPLTDDWR